MLFCCCSTGCHSVDYPYVECHLAESFYVVCHSLDCHAAEGRSVECHFAECHFVQHRIILPCHFTVSLLSRYVDYAACHSGVDPYVERHVCHSAGCLFVVC
jgi:hypothetical protein